VIFLNTQLGEDWLEKATGNVSDKGHNGIFLRSPVKASSELPLQIGFLINLILALDSVCIVAIKLASFDEILHFNRFPHKKGLELDCREISDLGREIGPLWFWW
jgi:hypothetical protein